MKTTLPYFLFFVFLAKILAAQIVYKHNNYNSDLRLRENSVSIKDSVMIHNIGVENSGKEIEEGLRIQRELWIEKSHRAAPGISWRDIENKNMIDNYYSNLALKKEKSSYTTNYANGQIAGTWAERGSNNQAGRCVGVDYYSSDNSLYVLSNDGCLFKGTPEGTNWHPVNDQLKFRNDIIKLVKNSSGGKRIITAIGFNIFFSDDEGLTFTPATGIVFPYAWGSIQEITCLSETSTLYLVVQEWDFLVNQPVYNLYSSADHGETWQRINTIKNGNQLYIWKPDWQQNIVMALFQDQNNTSTLYSIDEKSSVSILNTSTSLPANIHVFGGNNSGIAYTLYAVVGESGLYKSTDIGASWTPAHKLPVSHWAFAVSPNDANKIFTGQTEAYRSFNGGVSWTNVNSWASYYGDPVNKLHADIMKIKYFSKSNGTPFAIINCDGGCYRSDDDLQTVTNIGLKDLNVSEYYSVISDPQSNLFMGSQDQGFQRFLNSSADATIHSFDQVNSGDFGKLQLTRNFQTLWAEYPGGAIYYYYNSKGGLSSTWNLPGTTKSIWFVATAPVYPKNNNQIYIAGGNLSGGDGSYLVKLTGTESSVSATQGNYNFRGNTASCISAIATTPLDVNRIYVAREDGSFYYSVDAGANWQQTVSFSGPTPIWLMGNCIYASKKTPDLVLYGGSGYSNPPVYMSTNGGASFTPMSAGMPQTLVYGFAANANETFIYAATETGPYVFSMADKTWYPLGGRDTPALVYNSVDYDTINNIAHFSAFGRGIWDFRISSVTTEIDPLVKGTEINIYPNPFSNQTTLSFSQEQRNTLIKIVDLQGKEMKSLKFSGKQLTIEKSEMKEGMYLIEISDGKKTTSKKIVIQ
jgi:hypothetical protein